MGRLRSKARPLVWVSAGAAAAYFGDPEQGRSRRVRTKDQVLAACRTASRRLEQKGRHVQSAVAGKSEAVVGSQKSPPADDRTLADKVKSEVLGRPEFSELDVVLDAAEGAVTLRGEVADQTLAERLEKAVAAVPGVELVENLLHPSGEPAPNKEASLGA